MALQKFIDIFGGHKSLTLCQNLAIAHTESSIKGVDITPYQAHKFLIDNPEDSAQYDYKKSDWLELRAELSKFIRDNKSDRNYLHNQICEILMQLADVASYFISTDEKNTGESVNKLFNCIVETYLKATTNNSTATYEEILSSNEATRKWSRESLQTIARIGVALRKFGNLLQGCIYANNLKNAVPHYQRFCGVTLATEFTNSSIADATYWTKTYTKKICKQKKEEDPTDTPKDPEAAYGDVNCDGEVTIVDVLKLMQNLLSGTELTEQGILNADVDCDGSPTATDAMNILKNTISLITLPVVNE